MDNYEINILRRDGDWKKVKPDDLMIDTLENNEQDVKQSPDPTYDKSSGDFLYYLNEVNSIIRKLEVLENEKNKLKDHLKNYEQEFTNKKKNAEYKIHAMTKEKEMLDKTIDVIKNLKSF